MRFRDLIRYVGFLSLFTVLSLIEVLVFHHRRAFDTDMMLAAMCTTIWAVREGQPA